jgi:hypothetical protein
MKSFLQPSMNWLLAFIPISVVLERAHALGGHRQRSARDCRDVDDCSPIRDVS